MSFVCDSFMAYLFYRRDHHSNTSTHADYPHTCLDFYMNIFIHQVHSLVYCSLWVVFRVDDISQLMFKGEINIYPGNVLRIQTFTHVLKFLCVPKFTLKIFLHRGLGTGVFRLYQDYCLYKQHFLLRQKNFRGRERKCQLKKIN